MLATLLTPKQQQIAARMTDAQLRKSRMETEQRLQEMTAAEYETEARHAIGWKQAIDAEYTRRGIHS
ncbi:MAG: hypothetical protein KGL39_08175 [Patescibacteria group bacterium]|nr:hypothetical protein [Patescibacteria group bacterium]